MPDKFDPYREALVMETTTEWPEELETLDEKTKQRVANELHAHPEQASRLEYFRTHTGFCRKIIVTSDDVTRINA
jgi:hypothetical protein